MRARRLAALCVAASLVSGCQFTGLYGITLPGGGATGKTYRVTAIFDNVLDLVPQSAVKVADVTVGSVAKISVTADLKARVVLAVRDSVHLPANSVAILEQTSLLGEKFVELEPAPGVPPVGQLANGAVLSVDSTLTYPDIEEIFGTLSLILNGGGLQKIQTISFELAQALSGREGRIRDLLSQLTTFLGGLNQQKSEIVRALDALDRFSGELVVQKQTIATALDDLGPGLTVLANERSNLTAMLVSLSRLGVVGSRIIEASKDATITDLADLKPIVERVAAAGASLPRSLELLLDYPFPKSSANGIPGDYTGLYATFDLTGSAGTLCTIINVGVCPVALRPAAAGIRAGTSVPAAGSTARGGIGQPSPGSGSTGLSGTLANLLAPIGAPQNDLGTGLAILLGGGVAP